ncbi:MAG: GntR family transcriptional regulator [Pseudomonadota bacterium]
MAFKAPTDIPNSVPEGGKARRVYLLLKDDIARGALADGAGLPSEHKLAAQYQVSRVTIRRALDALLQDGLIEKRAGSGSRIRANGISRQLVKADIATLMPHLEQMAGKTEARLLEFGYCEASAVIAGALDLNEGARVQRAVRVRFMNGRPFSYLITHVPEEVALSYSEADLATQPLYALLELGGVRIGSANQTVSATLATPDVATSLNVAAGSALLTLERVVRDERGHGVEHLTASYRPDRFQLSMSLERVGDSENRHWEPIVGLQADMGALKEAAE